MFLVFTTGFHPGGQLYDVTKVILYFHTCNNYTGKSFQKKPQSLQTRAKYNPNEPFGSNQMKSLKNFGQAGLNLQNRKRPYNLHRCNL